MACWTAPARALPPSEEAEILIVNTCSFIDTAKQESIDTILEMARYKTSGRPKAHRRRLPGGAYATKSRKAFRRWTPSSAPANWMQFSWPPASRPPLRRPSHPHRQRTSKVRPGQESLSGTHNTLPVPKVTSASSRAASAATTGRAPLISSPPISTTKPPPLPDDSKISATSNRRGLRPSLLFCVIPNLRGKFRSPV